MFELITIAMFFTPKNELDQTTVALQRSHTSLRIIYGAFTLVIGEKTKNCNVIGKMPDCFTSLKKDFGRKTAMQIKL
jgi:hypothetical protein